MADRKQLITRTPLKQTTKKTKEQAEAEFNALLDSGGSVLDMFNCTCFKQDGKCKVHNPVVNPSASKQRVVQVTHNATTGEQKRVAAKSVAVDSKYMQNKRVVDARASEMAAEATTGALEKKQDSKKSSGWGGARAGGGRPAGTFNKRTAEIVEQLLAGNQTPLQFMLQEMQDTTQSRSYRLEAAKAVAPFLHAKLSSTEISGAGGKPLIPPVVGTVPVDAAAAVEFYKSLLGG